MHVGVKVIADDVEGGYAIHNADISCIRYNYSYSNWIHVKTRNPVCCSVFGALQSTLVSKPS